MNEQHTDPVAVNPDEPAHDGSQVLQLMDYQKAELRIAAWAQTKERTNAQAAATLARLLRYSSKRVKVNVKRALGLGLSAAATLQLVRMMRPNMAEVVVCRSGARGLFFAKFDPYYGTTTGRLTRTEPQYMELPRG